jgi:hypothetical protein
MSLELYERFERQTSIDSSREEGNAIGTFRPMIIDCLLRHLERVADQSNIDGWMDYVDPKLTYWENRAHLKEEAGATGFDSPFKSEKESWVSDMLDKQEEYEEQHKNEEPNMPKHSAGSTGGRTEPESELGKWAREHAEDRPRSGDGGEEILLKRERERTWQEQQRDWQH